MAGSNPYVNEATSFPLYAGEDITKGELICVADDGYGYLADADDPDKRPAVGIAEITVEEAEKVEVKSHGRVTNESSLTEGKPMYLSTTPGDVTQTPTGYTQVVGFAVSETDYELCICPPCHLITLQATVAGDITANDLANYIWSAPLAGMVLDLGIYAANTGADGTDDLGIEGDINIEGMTAMTTLPQLTDSAADGSNTFEVGTGITAGVVDVTANTFDRGDTLTWDLDLDRTTPEDEMADITIIVLLGLACE